MADDIPSGTTETTEAGSISYGAELNLAGQLDLAGEYRITSTAQFAASGTTDTAGTAEMARTFTPTAAGTGAGAFPTPRDTLVEAGTVDTIPAGTIEYANGLNLAGQLNLAGELGLTGAINVPSFQFEAAADGDTEATGTAELSRELRLLAAGTADTEGTGLSNIIYPLHREVDATITYDETEEIVLD